MDKRTRRIDPGPNQPHKRRRRYRDLLSRNRKDYPSSGVHGGPPTFSFQIFKNIFGSLTKEYVAYRKVIAPTALLGRYTTFQCPMNRYLYLELRH